MSDSYNDPDNAASAPQIPLLRTYVVHTCDPQTGELRMERYLAHEAAIGGDGNILQLIEYIIDPVLGPRPRFVRVFNGWEEFYEETPSSLVLPDRLIN